MYFLYFIKSLTYFATYLLIGVCNTTVHYQISPKDCAKSALLHKSPQELLKKILDKTLEVQFFPDYRMCALLLLFLNMFEHSDLLSFRLCQKTDTCHPKESFEKECPSNPKEKGVNIRYTDRINIMNPNSLNNCFLRMLFSYKSGYSNVMKNFGFMILT